MKKRVIKIAALVVLFAAVLVISNVILNRGNDDQVVPLLSLGGVGVISVLSNVMPKLTHDMVMSYLNGDVKSHL